ncbi:MAG: beta-N-acetylhexosaminidase [Myxococcales bacterium]|nr:beta-N-acetylhexosaminidase [Myxococcales bacterium]
MTPTPLREAAGRMLVAGFDGPALPAHVAAALTERRLGGVILFRRNVEEPTQVADLNEQVFGAARGFIPLVSVDQEGGRVQRIRSPATVLPPMATVGRTGDVELAVRLGQLIGDELDALGFNLDFAPVADTFTNPDNGVIGDRAFGSDPELVGRMAGALALGLTLSGIVPCAKHFPGHGDTLLDSHTDLPRVDHPLDRLRAVELRPFQALFRADLPMVMTAHLLIPAIDAEHPFTLSARGVGGLLREHAGYRGVVVSDDLEMRAVADRYAVEEMMVLGVEAGVDLFLICHTRERWEAAFEALVANAERSAAFRDRVEASAARLAKLEHDYLRPWQRPDDIEARLGTAEHAALIAEIERRAQ